MLRIRHAKNTLYIDQSLRCFDGILALAEANTPLWVFSLNHDVLIECDLGLLYRGIAETLVRSYKSGESDLPDAVRSRNRFPQIWAK